MNEDNSTINHTSTTDDVTIRIKIASLVFSYIAAPFVTYIAISLLVFSIRQRVKIDANRRRYNFLLKVLCILGAFSVLTFTVIELPFVAQVPAGYCPVYEAVRVISFGLSILSTYGVFWVRMLTTFYLEPLLKEHIQRWLHVFSRITFVILLIGAAVSTLLFLLPLRYFWTPFGCEVDLEVEVSLKWAVVALTTIVCQASLMFYFTYPIYMHRKRMITQGIDRSQALPFVKRLAVTMVLCVVVNIICYGVVIAYKTPNVFLSHLLLNINLVVHLAALVHSFTDWRRVLSLACYDVEWYPSQSPVNSSDTLRRNRSSVLRSPSNAFKNISNS